MIARLAVERRRQRRVRAATAPRAVARPAGAAAATAAGPAIGRAPAAAQAGDALGLQRALDDRQRRVGLLVDAL